MKNIRLFLLILLIFSVAACGKNRKTAYFGVEDEALIAPKEFGQTITAIEKAKTDARSDYQYRKIEEAMEKGRMASETYWECYDKEAKALLAHARQSAMEAEMFHPQPPPPMAARSVATLDPPASPESLSPDPPFAGVKTYSPEMVLDIVLFPYDSAALNAPERLKTQARGMTPKTHYEIAGHADSAGDPVYNQQLSERRAEAVQRYLKKKGLPSDKLVPVGYGEGFPAETNETDEGRAKNRRTEIRVTPPVFSPPAQPAYASLPPGTTIGMIHFNFASNRLIPVSRNSLDQILVKLKTDPAVKLEVAGYADNIGNDDVNLRISRKRARIVADYLSRKGVPGNRMILRGFGELDPFAPNDTSEGRALNRRVEIRILK